MSTASYIGRFAPSPTGPLHFGSLIAALGSYLQAKSHNGKWLVRIEDIDPPREVPGSAAEILRTLEGFGLHWDDSVLYQSTRLEHYQDAVERLFSQGLAYRCQCTRRQIAADGGSSVYSGLCRHAQIPVTQEHSVRVLTDRRTICVDDVLQGHSEHCLETEVGDYIIRRRDGLYAYQLAVTLDDDFQGVTEIVRGYDLLHTTARQIHLQRLLKLSAPGYLHLPLALDRHGDKLSKQSGAAALPNCNQSEILFDALTVLWQQPPPQLRNESVEQQLVWAIKNWNIKPLQNISAAELDEDRNVLKTQSGSLETKNISAQ